MSLPPCRSCFLSSAAHGWFGDAVRLECWEDFVLSEGTVTYMTGRALDVVGGMDAWELYVDAFLVPICTGADVNTVVLPDETCNTIDFENDDLWSLATYMKGACFYEDVGDLVGFETVDAAIAEYYARHMNDDGRMQEMIDLLKEHAGTAHADAIDVLATEWLRTYECPENYAERCRSHER